LCPGQVGRYLGLTGARLGPGDALACGFATHFVRRERLPSLVAALTRVTWRPGRQRAQVDEVLAAFRTTLGEAPLDALRGPIDRCFAGDTVEGILGTLANERLVGGREGEWATETLSGLVTKSPTSLKVTLHQLILGQGYDIEPALALEYRLTQHMMAGHDFYEGVRATLVDRDQKPQWQPATLAEVTDQMVDAYFAPLGDDELRFD